MRMILRTILSTAGMACLFSQTSAQAEQRTIKIMSWNVENFTDPFDDPYIVNEAEDLGAAKKDAQLKDMALAIRLVNPDIIAFQEIEGDRATKFFLDEYLPGHEYKHFAGAASLDWSQNNVVASKVPLGPITSFREIEMYNEVLDKSDKKYNPRLMMVEIRPTAEHSFLLANLHLKAGRDPEDPVWRNHQIDIVHDYLETRTKAEPELEILIMGDMNFEPTMPEYTYMLESGAVKLQDPLAGTGTVTHPGDAPRRQIDHVFFNDTMAKRYVADSAAVPLPISLDRLSRLSDHLPVVATFKIGGE